MPRFASRAPHAALHGPPCAVTRPPLTRQPIYPRAAGGTAPRVPARRRICGGHAAPVFQPPPCSPPLFRPAPKPRRTPYPLPRNTRPCPGPHCMCPVHAFLLLLFVFLVNILHFVHKKGAVSDRDGSLSTRPTAPAGCHAAPAGRRTEHRRPGRTGPALRSQSPRAVPVYSAGASRLHRVNARKKTGRQYPPGSARGNAPPILRIQMDYACAPVSLRPYPACLSIMSFTFIRRTWVLRSFSSSFMTM